MLQVEGDLLLRKGGREEVEICAVGQMSGEIVGADLVFRVQSPREQAEYISVAVADFSRIDPNRARTSSRN